MRPCIAIALLLVLAGSPASAAPQNVILMVGDGMGFEHVAAARLFNGGPLAFEGAPHQASMTTDSFGGQLTDSAASATAMATGRKVQNTVLSAAIPGDLSDLTTQLEIFQARGKATGLVTTAEILDATPAAFGAHALLRAFFFEVASDYLTETRPNVLLGGGHPEIPPADAAAAGYTVVGDRAGLQALPSDADRVAGLFGSGPLPFEHDYAIGFDDGYDTLPFLSEMTAAALSILERDPDGFFLLVEQEGTDAAGHQPNPSDFKTERNIRASLEFSNAAEVVLDWAEGRDDTLIIVTADHETGGLEVLADNGPGVFPDVSWSTGGVGINDHTAVPVPVYAWGPNAERVTGVIDNTDIFHIATVPEPGTVALLGLGLAALCRVRRAAPGA